MKPFKALLVEGTSGVGKSTLIDALIRRHVSSVAPRKIRSLIHLAQSHTYGPLVPGEDEGTLTVKANLDHLDRIANLLDWLHASVQEHDKPWCFLVIDTLHLTHCVRPGVVRWSDVQAIDRRLAALDCKLLFLRAQPKALWERGIVPRIDRQFLEYAKKFGRTHEEIHQYFALVDLFSCSVMPKLILSNDEPSDAAADRAFEFWNEE